MIIVVLIIGKTILWLLRRLHRTGSALPGLVAEKLYKPFLPKMLAQLPHHVVVVSGTNGKTTTTKLIVELLRSQGMRVLTNQTGSNFERGITSAVIDKASLSGTLAYDIAVLELDEAHAVHFSRRVPPVGLVALNVMRDQMDRFGEIDTTANLLAKVAASTTDWLVLNANDVRISQLAEANAKKYVMWFGYDRAIADSFVSDDSYYDQAAANHQAVEHPDICLTSVIDKHGNFSIRVGDHTAQLTTKLEGSHNALNIVAALAAVNAIMPKADPDVAIKALAAAEPAFGRGEHIRLTNGCDLRLQLVKNPAGFSYVLQALETQPARDVVGIAINDEYADGRDVSWLWDVQFQALQGPKLICGGTRAYDMAVRLKYDDLQATTIATDLEAFLEDCLQLEDKTIVIFSTYTAMLRLRELLKTHGDIAEVSV